MDKIIPNALVNKMRSENNKLVNNKFQRKSLMQQLYKETNEDIQSH
ncbi:MAG: hypothetical protein ABI405_08895 [Parafilimonas sp.]